MDEVAHMVQQLNERINTLAAENQELRSRYEEIHRNQQPTGPVLEPKVMLPEKFTGKHSDLRNFISALRNVLELQPYRYQSDRSKTGLVGSLCLGDALSWYRNLQESESPMLHNFSSFIDDLRSHFGDPYFQENARRQLLLLSQGKSSASTYASRFRRIATDTDFNDATLCYHFERGLNIETRRAIAVNDQTFNSLEELIRYSTKVDNRLFEFSRDTASYLPPQSSMNHTPMEIGKINVGRKLTSTEKMHRFKNGLCLYCGESGHIVGSCPKKKPLKKQIPISVLLDTGATGNFIDYNLVKLLKAPLVSCSPVPLSLFDGSPHNSGPVTHVTASLELKFNSCYYSCSLFVSSFPSASVILGYPWFKYFNPVIDWNSLLVTFNYPKSLDDLSPELVKDTADALSRRYDFKKEEDGSISKQKITLLPDKRWHKISTVTSQRNLFNHDIDIENDWPLIVEHFLKFDSWPDNLPENIINKCKNETKYFRLFGSNNLEFQRITREGPVDYLKFEHRQEKVNKYHTTLGHMSFDSILPLLKRRFWFPRMEQKIKQIVSNCSVCQLNRSDSQSTHSAPLRPITPAALPFERWGIDFVGPIPTSKSGNSYILTAIDYATRWVVAQPYPDKSSRSVMHFIYNHIVMQYGPPFEIISDRDKAFLEDALPHYEQLLRIKHLPTTSYHPRTNGMVERMHQMLNHSLRCLTQDHMNRWDEFLPQTVFAIRSRQHSVTKYSPFYLMFGVEPRLPCDTTPPRSTMQPLDELEQMEERHEFNARQFEELGLARRAATERTMAQAEIMLQRNKKTHKEDCDHRFEIGDWVKLRMHKKNKWDRQWAGPFMIVKLYFPHTYYIMSFRGDWLDTPVNEERLAKWKGTSAEDINPVDEPELFSHLSQELTSVEDNSLEEEDNLLANEIIN
ncbi:Retrotransposon-derived protein PEG10 [Smittium culicis]|uniref:Retrotransposon-derived protein PEG10 n=1 Tax=Smittium culicis TaxID=133412 RepID=A0A1R1XE84_9FUNG|nr:Retrotransposon-derived protein PEG10 [Smittium culicis]